MPFKIRQIGSPLPFQRAVLWSLFWLGIALLSTLGIWIFFPQGSDKAVAFLAGYLVEESLSVDNLFVFLMLFTYFRVAPIMQRRVLNYGVIGVIILRGALIFAAIELVDRFEFLIYIFGGIVLSPAFK